MFSKPSLAARNACRGSVFVLVLIWTVLLSLMVVGLAQYATYQTQDRARYEIYKDEFAAADVAINKAYAQFQHMITFSTPNFDTQVAAITPPTVSYYDNHGDKTGAVAFSNFQVTNTFAGFDTISDPSERWYGLNLYQRRYSIAVTARKTGGIADKYDHQGVTAVQSLEIRYIPLYMFAIFYDPVMEIAPGPYMQVNGLVHANGDAYFQSGGGLDFTKNVTIAGDVYHGRSGATNESVSNSAVNFYNGSALSNMLSGGQWLDSTVTSWAAKATDRWNGHFKNAEHGVLPLNLPIPAVTKAHSIIERADPANDTHSLQQEKFEYKAGMKIVREPNGSVVGYNAHGTVVPLTYPDPADPEHSTKSIYKETTFYDAREGKWVNSIDVDLGNMIEANTISQAEGGPSLIPENGILYVTNEDQGATPGVVRLVNGARLPTSPVSEGFSVASDDPMYVKGDYNTVNKTLAMVAADALYILSNAWQDGNSSNFAARTASATKVNAVCMHGIVPSAGGTYSGGVENNFRFLEKWTGKDFTFNGSIVIMWESEKAIGKWKYGSPVYEAPRRIWAWDAALGGVNGPPGAPRVVEIEKTDWRLGGSVPVNGA